MKKVWKPVGRIAKAAGIVIVIGIVAMFTMAMAIRPLRTGFWNAIVEWYENYVFVSLPDAADLPQEIEEIKFPSNIPEGWTITVDSKRRNSVSSILSGLNDELIFLDQMVIGPYDDTWLDRTETMISEIMLSGEYKAQLAEYSDGSIILIWKKSYVYYLSSFNCSLDLVKQIAESID